MQPVAYWTGKYAVVDIAHFDGRWSIISLRKDLK